jgi:type II secretory pathway pseudopilin PulG
MKKLILQILLLIAIIIIGYLVYDSIMKPVEFSQEKRKRELVVIEKLKDIRLSQAIYRRMNGTYSTNFDTLIAYLTDAEIPVVKMIPDPEDTTFTKTINDTIGYIKVADSLFKTKPYQLSELWLIPFSNNVHFEMDADTIERGGVDVHVFVVFAPYTAYLYGMDKQTIINLIAKQEDIERYPGLKVGSMTEPSTDGNWE